jgi:hypothetical protein
MWRGDYTGQLNIEPRNEKLPIMCRRLESGSSFFYLTPVAGQCDHAVAVTDYFAFSKISTSRQRLVADSGRVSISDTRSPMPATLFSSCAFTFLVVRMIFP